MIYSKEKFDAILFSNNIESGFKNTYHSEDENNKRRFIIFYESLIGEGKENSLFINRSLIDEERKIDSLSKDVKNKSTIENIILENNDDKVFTEEPQIPPEFPGGQQSWFRFLERTLNKDLPLKNGAPIGKYTVLVAFIVGKDGSVSDIKAENNPGYGTKDEAIRVISRGPKWKPAVQNGRIVVYRHRVKIEFEIF